MSTIHEIPVVTINGEETTFGTFAAGKTTLVVNVASKCGLTPQYEGLEALYQQFKDQDFVILGFPCDQFAHQEPGSDAEIAQFCSLTYGVSFPMFKKIEVNGDGAHPLFAHLKKAAPGLLGSEGIKWNFTKFLVNPQGEVVTRFGPKEEPASFAKDIEKALAASTPSTSTPTSGPDAPST